MSEHSFTCQKGQAEDLSKTERGCSVHVDFQLAAATFVLLVSVDVAIR